MHIYRVWNLINLSNHKRLFRKHRFLVCTYLCKTCYPDFRSKWSWGFCVMPLRRNAHNRLEFDQFYLQCMFLDNWCWENNNSWDFWYVHICAIPLAKPATTTFEVNGHDAFVWCHCDAMHITGWNLINLTYNKRIWLNGVEKTSVFRIFGMFLCKTC